jgi:Fe-S cluster assembly protein SufD
MAMHATMHATPRLDTDRIVGDWRAMDGQLNGAEPSFARGLRRAAIGRFAELGYPTPRQEAWRLTNVAPIAATTFARPAALPTTVTAAAIQPFVYDGCARLVFVDGLFAPHLSDTAGLPAGVVAGGLAESLATRPELVEPHLASLARHMEHPFVALNTAFLRDGAFVWVPRGVVVETPILLLFIASAGESPRVSYPRNLIVAGENSQCKVVESYAGLSDHVYFTCPVTEVVVGQGAVVDHYKVQKESTAAYHVATLAIGQDRGSTFDSHAVLTGGGLVRNDVIAVLGGEGGSCTLNGLYVVTGDQHVDNQMLVEHVAPHCTSYELYKGILDGRSSAVFNGRIYVHPGAQKTDAVQANRNLILSADAIAHSNPQLEIFASDVRCTHGSTVGQLDEDAVFYLRSRGIGEAAAKSILTYAFAADIVDRIKVEAVRTDLAAFLFERLPRGEVVRQSL